MHRLPFAFLATIASASPAFAEVTLAEHGFTIENTAIVGAAPADVWSALVEPSRYWSPDHSFSGDASNFSLDARAGGCFCEALPEGGSVEHLRVVMVQPGQVLGLSGALGPLQSEGLAGGLTWRLEAAETGTRITQTYVVGGHMRYNRETFPPIVGSVLREQLERLAALFESASD